MELGARFLVPLVNWNMRRFHTECADALSVGRNGSGGDSILFIGNSLTLTDVDMRAVGERFGGTNEVRRWAIDDTNFLDWYYGLQRAYRSGARPKWVIIGARSGHLLAGHVRGRFFAHYILGFRDLPNAAARTGANPTAFSNMLLAQFSAFYGSRDEIFKRWVTLVLPSFRTLGGKLNSGGLSQNASRTHREQLLMERLAELRSLTSCHGSRLVLWIPPTLEGDSLAASVHNAGDKAGVPTLVLQKQGEWTKDDFTDGLHMTPVAATRFSHMLTEALAALFASR